MVPIISYISVLILVFWPALFPPPGTLLFGDDIHRSYHFFRLLFHDAVSGGQFPFWNPYLFSGEPLIANPSVAFWYPFNWLFAILPYRYVYSWIIPVHIFVAMSGMYYLVRQIRQISPIGQIRQINNLGAWIAGLVFGLSGYFMGRVWEGHVELILAAAWMPWIVISNIKYQISNRKKDAVIAAVALAMQLYAGYQTMALLTLEAVGIVTLLNCYIVKNFRPLIRAGIVIIIGLGLAGLQIIPSQEFFSRSIRTYELPYSWAVFGSYTVENLKQLIAPFILGGPGNYRGPSPNYGEMAAFFGVVPLALAILGLLKPPKLLMSIPFFLIGFFGLWVSFGWNAPVDFNRILWDTIPTYKYLRIPSRHLILFVFGMSALAGLGFSFVRRKGIQVILAVLVTLEMIWFGQHFILLKPDPERRHNKELVTYLGNNLGLSRFLPNFNVGMGTRDALDFDAAMDYKLFSASGYDPAILRNYYEFAAAAGKIESPDVQRTDVQIPYLVPSSRYTDFLNIRYILVPSWFDSVAGSSKFSLVLEENKKDFWKLYENTATLPRFFLAPSLVMLPNRDDVARAIRNETYDTSRTILTDSAASKNQKFSPDCSDEKLPPVQIVSYSYNRIVLSTDASCNSFLATGEVIYPGWEATIDGSKAQLFEGNLAFRTMYVPAGKHTITMVYKPKIFYLGGLLTVATAIVCLFWIRKKK